jgi:POT family proton-dependent oligopeptide transporter
MGSWFLSIAFAHKIAGFLGQLIAGPGGDEVSKDTALTAFTDVYLFWGVYVVLGAALLLLLLSPLLRKWMHGIH